MGHAEASSSSSRDTGGGGGGDASTSGSREDVSDSSGSGGFRRFPLAAQPEIMRAAEKDDQYASFVYEACRDAFRQLFGIITTLHF